MRTSLSNNKKEEKKELDTAKKVIELAEILEAADELEFRDVVIDAENVVLELIPPLTPSMPTRLKLVLEPVGAAAPGKVELMLEATPSGLRLVGAPAVPGVGAPVVEHPALEAIKGMELLKLEFKTPPVEFKYDIAEVQIGATKAEGGSRGKVIKVGGEKAPLAFRFLEIPKNRPVVALDVFDSPPPLPKHVKKHYMDVLHNPPAWARKAINMFGADLCSVHLVSTDPGFKDAPPSEAVKTIEEVLQTVDTPIIVGGSGNPEKDLKVFDAVGAATQGERLVLASVTLDMDVPKYCEIVNKYGHVALALAFMDINQVREIAKKVLDNGVPRDRMIVDPSTGGLGYGIEYSFSIMERMKLLALNGAEELRAPISCAATNAWAAREAWMKDVPEWGPREWRGPLWESATALSLMLAGADLFMMLHPLSAKIVKSVCQAIASPQASEFKSNIQEYYSWVTSNY